MAIPRLFPWLPAFLIASLLSAFLLNAALLVPRAEADVCPHGYETFNDHVLNAVGSYGSLQRAYWIDSSITSNYPNWSSSFSGYPGGFIGAAAADWNNTYNNIGYATSVSIYRVYNSSESVFRFYNAWYERGVIGLTVFKSWSSTADRNPLYANWDWNYIYLNCAYMSEHVTNEQAKGTSGHELGHAMGLAHRNTLPSSLMCQLGRGRTANSPQSFDCLTINHLY